MRARVVLSAALVLAGCARSPIPVHETTVGAPWEKSTRIESAWEEPGHVVVLKYSQAFQFKTASEQERSINIQGMVAHTYRKGTVDTTRGLYVFIGPSRDPSTFGDAYVDLDELPDFLAAIDRFSVRDPSLELPGGLLVGISFKTKGLLHFRTGSAVPGFVIGSRKIDDRSKETSVSDLTRADLANIRANLVAAKEWAEQQRP